MPENILPTIADAPAKEIVIAQEGGLIVEYAKSYGIGIDTHSKFIQVSVLVKRGDHYFEYRHEFGTDWPSLIQSRDWARAVLEQCSDPPVDDTGCLHYCIESTAVYHFPVLMAWEGTPSVVTPSIAGATKRKTDVLDAKLLATHDLTSVWPATYVPSSDVKQLRLLLNERANFNYMAVHASNRVNNYITRFGVTVGRQGSVSRNQRIRSMVEGLASDDPPENPLVCPDGIPEDIRPVIRMDYEKHDEFRKIAQDYEKQIIAKVKSMEWETGDGTIPGGGMLEILTSAPNIGPLTACLWLANTITPRRFPNSKAVAAYCGLDPSLKVSAKHVTSTAKRGGNKRLHSALTQAASRLIKNHTELFGKWGYQLYLQSGHWKKATNAVARKLAVALYYIQLTGKPFSYEKYNLLKETVVIDIPIDELPALNSDFKRYIKVLKENGVYTTSELAKRYYTCDLNAYKGLGRKFFACMRDFVSSQGKYRKLYSQLHTDSTDNITGTADCQKGANP